MPQHAETLRRVDSLELPATPLLVPLFIYTMLTVNLFPTVVFVVLVAEVCGVCEHGQTREGCRIQNGACLCGVGCYSEYRYTNMEECRKSLRGRRMDVCHANPCENGGACSQTSFGPGYRCRCEGTGYYGSRCEHACPTTSFSENANFPYECIVI